MESEVGERAHNIKVENKTSPSHNADYELEEIKIQDCRGRM